MRFKLLWVLPPLTSNSGLSVLAQAEAGTTTLTQDDSDESDDTQTRRFTTFDDPADASNAVTIQHRFAFAFSRACPRCSLAWLCRDT